MKIIDTETAIIGGGASGLAAAIAASRYGCGNVTVLEKMQRVGKKILSTGNGRCNLTNRNISPADYTGDTELLSYISPDIDNAEDFFSSLGLICRADDNGRVYPYSNAATSVLDALRFAADSSGIRTVCDFTVSEITKAKHGFIITDGETQVKAKRVIIAAGGKAAPSLGSSGEGYELCRSLGHSVTRLFPALAPVRTDIELVKSLKGLRVAADATLISGGRVIDRQSGEVQFTDGALSGICIFNLSAKAAEYNPYLSALRSVASRCAPFPPLHPFPFPAPRYSSPPKQCESPPASAPPPIAASAPSAQTAHYIAAGTAP